MAPKTKIEYQTALRQLGEEPPVKWTTMELSVRLQELETEMGVTTGRQDNLTDLQKKTRELNKASKKKPDLMLFMEENLKLPVQKSYTIKELQKQAMDYIYTHSELDKKDPVGFGQHANMSYGEIKEKQPQYCEWVMQTSREGESGLRLQRLAQWLELQKDGHKVKKEMATGSASRIETPPPQHQTEMNTPDNSMVTQMVGAMKQMMSDMKDMKDEMEDLRGRAHKKPAKEEDESI